MHKFAEQIVQCVKNKVEARGIDNVQPAELEEVSKWVEMARDLVAYDKDMRIVKAMDEEEKYDEIEMRMGYNNRRYANGRYAPKGRGRRMGYMPTHTRPMEYWDEDDYMSEYLDDADFMSRAHMRMGYNGSGNGGSGGGNSGGGNRGNSGGGSQSGRAGYDGGNYYGYTNDGQSGGGYGYSNERMNGGGDSKYGKSYNQYKNSRRGYTETHSPEHQQKMKESISEIFNDMEEMVTDIWKDVEPAEKQKYKTKMQQMLQKMQ